MTVLEIYDTRDPYYSKKLLEIVYDPTPSDIARIIIEYGKTERVFGLEAQLGDQYLVKTREATETEKVLYGKNEYGKV